MSHGCVIGCDNIIHPGWDRSKEIADHKSLTVATNVRSISAIHVALALSNDHPQSIYLCEAD